MLQKSNLARHTEPVVAPGWGWRGVNHTTAWESARWEGTHVPGGCTYCPGSRRCYCASRSSTTAGGWRPWSPTGCSSLPRCTTRSGPGTTPRHGARTQSGSVCLQTAHGFVWGKRQKHVVIMHNPIMQVEKTEHEVVICSPPVLPCVCCSSVHLAAYLIYFHLSSHV